MSKLFEHKIVVIFLLISFNMYFWCAKEPPYSDGSFEYTQYMFRLRTKKEKKMLNYKLLF